ncbi:metal ABC transporter substrate-binding protein [Lactobacillus bombi]|nr:metal ABC transporter substrate-binding protein [Bombilactobacillus bombi]
MIISSGCHQGTQAPKTSCPIKIVASTPTYGQLAQAVVGKYGQVTTIMSNPNIDPHDFDPTVRDAEETSKSQIALYNGLGYDSWMQRLLVNNEQVTSINLGKLMHKKMGSNPHLWYHPDALPTGAVHLATILSQKDPAHRHYYQQQAQKYIQTLQPLQKQIQQIKSTRRQHQVAVSEPVFDYSLQQMGYQVANPHFAKAIEEGADPSPQDIQQVQQLIKNRQIAFFVDNQQATNPVVANLVAQARKQRIPVIKVTETQPRHLSYSQWMQQQYQKILKIEAQK